MRIARHIMFGLCFFLPACADRDAGTGKSRDATVRPATAESSNSDARSGASDFNILFVGNSHTIVHDIPRLVCKMISFRFPDRRPYSSTVGVAFLADAFANGEFKQELDARTWKYLVLQAQKISQSGRYLYSRKEGIEMAKLARSRGAGVIFYSEWGLRGKPGDGRRNEKIYGEMAKASGAAVAPVGTAWDLALARRPDLPLYSDDGNHQAPTGAFLTACVLFGRLTGETPTVLASFNYPGITEKDRKLLTQAAADALASKAVD
jgi:hypothetical protein